MYDFWKAKLYLYDEQKGVIDKFHKDKIEEGYFFDLRQKYGVYILIYPYLKEKRAVSLFLSKDIRNRKYTHYIQKEMFTSKPNQLVCLYDTGFNKGGHNRLFSSGTLPKGRAFVQGIVLSTRKTRDIINFSWIEGNQYQAATLITMPFRKSLFKDPENLTITMVTNLVENQTWAKHVKKRTTKDKKYWSLFPKADLAYKKTKTSLQQLANKQTNIELVSNSPVWNDKEMDFKAFMKTSRLISQREAAIGIGTDKQFTSLTTMAVGPCVAILVHNKNLQKISLAHIDGSEYNYALPKFIWKASLGDIKNTDITLFSNNQSSLLTLIAELLHEMGYKNITSLKHSQFNPKNFPSISIDHKGKVRCIHDSRKVIDAISQERFKRFSKRANEFMVNALKPYTTSYASSDLMYSMGLFSK